MFVKPRRVDRWTLCARPLAGFRCERVKNTLFEWRTIGIGKLIHRERRSHRDLVAYHFLYRLLHLGTIHRNFKQTVSHVRRAAIRSTVRHVITVREEAMLEAIDSQ